MNCFAPSWKEEQNMNWDKDIQNSLDAHLSGLHVSGGSRRRCLTAS